LVNSAHCAQRLDLLGARGQSALATIGVREFDGGLRFQAGGGDLAGRRQQVRVIVPLVAARMRRMYGEVHCALVALGDGVRERSRQRDALLRAQLVR
jgi:hypothetical protein